MTTQGFDATNQKRLVLISVLQDISTLIGEPQPTTDRLIGGDLIAPGLGLISDAQLIEQRVEDIKKGIFKIFVLGEFNHGKSTLINAMLGDKMLPVKALPSTAVITVLVHGDQDEIAVYEVGQESPRIISWDVFATELTLTAKDRFAIQNHQHLDRFQHIEYVQITRPYPLLANGLSVIDSPGLAEHISRTRIISDYLRQAQAMIFVLDATQPLSKEEREFIKSLGEKRLNHVFFVVNRIDLLEEELSETKKWIQSSLQDYFLSEEKRFDEAFYHRRVFFTNAKAALEARLSTPTDQAKLEESGVPSLENELERFLTSDERMNALLQSSVELLIYVTSEARHRIIYKKAAYERPLDALQKAFLSAERRLNALEQRQQDLEETILHYGQVIKLKVYDDLLHYLTQMQLDWPKDAQKIKLEKLPLSKLVKTAISEKEKTKVATAIEEDIHQYLSEKLKVWTERVPAVVQHDLEALVTEIERQIAEFQFELDRINDLFSGIPASQYQDKDNQKNQKKASELITRVLNLTNPSQLTEELLERDTFVDYGRQFMDWIDIAQKKFKKVTISLSGTIPIQVIGLILFGIPIELARIFLDSSSLREKLLPLLGEKLHQSLRQSVEERQEEIQQSIAGEFTKLAKNTSKVLQQKIDTVRTEHQTIISQKKDQTFSFEQEKKRLDAIEKKLLECFNCVHLTVNHRRLTWPEIERRAKNKAAWQTIEPEKSKAEVIIDIESPAQPNRCATPFTVEAPIVSSQDIYHRIRESLGDLFGLPDSAANTKIDQISRELADLIGLQTVKVRIVELFHYFAEEKRRSRGWSKGERPTLHMAFTGNPGTGKATVARLIGRIYRKLGLLEVGHTVEADITELISHDAGNSAHDTNKKIDEALDGVLFIDEAYQLTDPSYRISYGRESLTVLLNRMEKDRHRLAVIVAGYPDKMKKFMESHPGLSRRIPAENVIHFPDYNPTELLEILFKMLLMRNFTCSPDAKTKLGWVVKGMHLNRDSSAKFGNAGEMRNLANHLIRKRAKRVAEKGLPIHEPIRPEDIPAIYAKVGPDDKGETELAQIGIEQIAPELAKLVGLSAVKERVVELYHYFAEEKRRREAGLSGQDNQVTLHMVFTGNPGTGKTTVARIISKTYRKLGLLTKGHIVEVSATELISRYAGGTAHETNKKIDEAIGGVLFIDEAYQLTDQPDHPSYGQESLNLLLTRMENERERLAVIVAGYPDKMKTFMDANPGLSRRIPAENVIHFPDYTPTELLEILFNMLLMRDFTCSPDAKLNLSSVVKGMHLTRDGSAKFGNAREMRNLADQMILKRARRVAEKGLPIEESIRPEDIPAQYQISDPVPAPKRSPVIKKRPIDKPIRSHDRPTRLHTPNVTPTPRPDVPMIGKKPTPRPDVPMTGKKPVPPPNPPSGNCTTLRQEGERLLQQNHYPEALEKLQAALACYQKAGDKAEEAATLNQIGSVYDKQGRYAEAVASWEKVKEI